MANPTDISIANNLVARLKSVYGEEDGHATFNKLKQIVENYSDRIPMPKTPGLNQRDAILITYGDQVQKSGEQPLRTLAALLSEYLTGIVSGVHILPFYPYSSDDGFSVIDYRTVDPALGNWEDISAIGRNFRLMFDAVINHISVQSAWFQGFLKGNPRYQDYFIEVKGNPDLSKVVRPRALSLLTSFESPSGIKQIWTTFSTDQVDLNYRNPNVLLEIIKILLFYASKGAEFIRLDAIAYLWKEIGTACIHLPQTHGLIQLMRAVLDQAAPHLMLITETNVPHEENISYFGNGYDEAQMVYNFALPPVVLYTLYTENAGILSEWASRLKLPSRRVTFFNFLASHDGIGINPARGILPAEGVEMLIQKTLERGGLVSYKHNPDGSQSPYELNINFFDALWERGNDAPYQEQIDRFMAAQAIMLALIGVPGIYFHSIFGSRGWSAGVQLTGRNRTINRQKLVIADLERELRVPDSLRSQVYKKFTKLLRARADCPAFHPFGDQRVIDCGNAIFAILRYSPDRRRKVLCLQSVTEKPRVASIDLREASPTYHKLDTLDLISGKVFTLDQNGRIFIEPYQTLWFDLSR